LGFRAHFGEVCHGLPTRLFLGYIVWYGSVIPISSFSS
jgi:hypothetical protein